jgi:hypothetical protein
MDQLLVPFDATLEFQWRGESPSAGHRGRDGGVRRRCAHATELPRVFATVISLLGSSNTHRRWPGHCPSANTKRHTITLDATWLSPRPPAPPARPDSARRWQLPATRRAKQRPLINARGIPLTELCPERPHVVPVALQANQRKCRYLTERTGHACTQPFSQVAWDLIAASQPA